MGCRICELACALGQQGLSHPDEANISVHIESNGEVNLIINPECLCRSGPVCVELCPVDVLEVIESD